MPTFSRDGIEFNYHDVGHGVPFVFLHGLGGELTQPIGFVSPQPPHLRLISMDARGHGHTKPVGDECALTIPTFADDVIALLDRLKIDRGVVGGISMGSAIAINLAVRYPGRVQGLVLSRPAWLFEPDPPNLRVLGVLARLIRELGPTDGAMTFARSPEYAEHQRLAPECAATLLNQFASPRAVDAVARLERVPQSSPVTSRREIESIRVPTLVLGCRFDTIHPYEIAADLSRAIPGARFAEITSKSADIECHAADTRREIFNFLKSFIDKDPSP